jgi:hypothetical protein
MTVAGGGQITSPNGNPTYGWSTSGLYPLSTDGFSGTTWGSGERALNINPTIELVNYIYAVLQDAGIIAGG